MPVNISIPELGDLFQDYRDAIPGDSYNWGPAINANSIRLFAIHHSVTPQLLNKVKLPNHKTDKSSLYADANNLGDEHFSPVKVMPKAEKEFINPQTAIGDGNWKAECDTIANEHLAEGWGGVGYRFIICSNGVVAYVGDLSHGGSAVAGNNDIIFSACMVGDFTKQLPTAAQVHSAHILANFMLTKMPQYPNLSTWDQVIGHQDAYNVLHLPGATATACPGSNWRDPSDSLRNRIINDNYKGYPNPQPAGSTPAPTPTPAPQPTIAQVRAVVYGSGTDASKVTQLKKLIP